MAKSQFLSNCTKDVLVLASSRLMAGNLVTFPTETVYGLGADACNSAAVARIYSVKGRPIDHPLIIHIASMARLSDWAREIPDYAIMLARNYWPGPMTLVLKRTDLAPDFVTGGQDTVGLRVPNHVVALALLEAFEKMDGKGVAAPSANRFGHVSPTTAAAVIEELGSYLSEDDLVLDGGACDVGVESTIIDCTGAAPSVLRPGAISVAMIEICTGLKTSQSDKRIRVSGALENHYAPIAKVLLCESANEGQGFIADSSIRTPEGAIRLASPSDDEEFARILYSSLREADAQGLKEVVVIEPIGIGIAVAIRDRLARAANGR
jgi:L-threonylcarbamoyladenylate synthase